MPDIIHRIEINVDKETVFSSLTTEQGLKGWWTNDVVMESPKIGSVIEFRFDGGGPDMKITELEPSHLVVWKCVAGPEEWIDTVLSFSLTTSGENTVVFFAHRNWKEEVEFMGHCSCKWAQFMLSLKLLLESGVGKPYPNDTKLGEWG